MSEVIITSQCETCQSGTINDKDKAIVKVYCSYKDREYYFGQCIQCDNYNRKKVV